MNDCRLYDDPDLYDLLFPGAAQSHAVADKARRERILSSERFYLDEARRAGGRVLELACGSGRLTVPIALNGIEILGADLSPAMLDLARAKASAAGVNTSFVQADMRCFDLQGEFSAILIPGNSLLHLLAADEIKECLGAVRRHLAPGGRLIFDVGNPNVRLLARDSGQRYSVLRVHDPQLGEISLEETVSYDAAAQISNIRWYFSAPRAPDFKVIDYCLRVIFPQELLLLLEAAGFRLEARYGELTRAAFESSSPRQVCVCSLV